MLSRSGVSVRSSDDRGALGAGPSLVLVIGLGFPIAADIILAFAQGLFGLFVGVALWGAFMGLSQGLLSALVADTAPDDLRGTAFAEGFA